METFIYLEIIKKETKEVVKRIDVSKYTENQIMRCEMGILINLNTQDYYVCENESEFELEIIK